MNYYILYALSVPVVWYGFWYILYESVHKKSYDNLPFDKWYHVFTHFKRSILYNIWTKASDERRISKAKKDGRKPESWGQLLTTEEYEAIHKTDMSEAALEKVLGHYHSNGLKNSFKHHTGKVGKPSDYMGKDLTEGIRMYHLREYTSLCGAGFGDIRKLFWLTNFILIVWPLLPLYAVCVFVWVIKKK